MSVDPKEQPDRILNAADFAAECKAMGYPPGFTRPEHILNYCQCDSPYLMRNEGKSVHCGVCEKVFDYQAWLVRPQNPTHENIRLHHEWTLGKKTTSQETPDPRRVQCEAVALKIYEQLERIQSEALYAGQVQQSGDAVQGEWCIQVADIIQRELEWL